MAERHRGLRATAPRSIDNLTGGACLFALAHEILRLVALRD